MAVDDARGAVLAAVADNADWCDVVCRSLDRRTDRTATLWAASHPPRWYPHRVTLTSGATAAETTAGLSRATECWVKDSFATLDLTGHGFSSVVEASWFHSPPQSPMPRAGWSLVSSADELERWAAASGTAGVLTAPLLTDPSVRIVGVRDGPSFTGGAVLSCGTEVVGVSNVFSTSRTPEGSWAAAVAAASQVFPGRDLVGYEHGDDLDAARRVGFSVTGVLRLWRRPGASPVPQGRLPLVEPANDDRVLPVAVVDHDVGPVPR